MERKKIFHKVFDFFKWKWIHFRENTIIPFVYRFEGSWAGHVARGIRWPLMAGRPAEKSILHLVRGGGIGDVLMCTPALRLIRKKNPVCRIVFYTRFPSLLEGLPCVDQALPIEEVTPEAIYLEYIGSRKPRRHLAKIFGDQLGVNVRDVEPDCHFDREFQDSSGDRLKGLPKPWITLSRHASDWTPNKQWPEEYWDNLVDRLLSWATVIELGAVQKPAKLMEKRNNYLNLTGKQTLDQLIATLSKADLNVGPISGPIHIAAAFGVPSVVIYGGYESPSCSNYRGNRDLHTDLKCSPCWLREPCPIDRKCLRDIFPETVEKNLRELWKQGNSW